MFEPNSSEPANSSAPARAGSERHTRRSLLATMMASGSAVIAGILAIPALLAAMTPAIRGRREARWRSVGRLEEFPIDSVQKALVTVDRQDSLRSLNEKAVYVWRRTAGEVVVYARNCTDLSCPINYDPGSAAFYCPCHGGIFAKDGTPLAGPPRMPLYRFENRVRDGAVEINLNSLPPIT
jgi:menaquinol-cytochrome c reductase iron-sulfur subunit